MPFLATDWTSWEQRVLAAAARHHGHRLAAAVEGLQQGPSWLQDRLVHLMQPGAEPHAAQALRAALNPHGLRNNWHMAAHEFRWGASAGCCCYETALVPSHLSICWGLTNSSCPQGWQYIAW